MNNIVCCVLHCKVPICKINGVIQIIIHQMKIDSNHSCLIICFPQISRTANMGTILYRYFNDVHYIISDVTLVMTRCSGIWRNVGMKNCQNMDLWNPKQV
eukprot:NODE_242_length_11906_cov_0.577454.p9 type:complete len:100 gc:universal NODE_242_length_11906_cov_0.577454:8368-8667(+)